jgi:hypothetical protein
MTHEIEHDRGTWQISSTKELVDCLASGSFEVYIHRNNHDRISMTNLLMRIGQIAQDLRLEEQQQTIINDKKRFKKTANL